MRAALSIRGRLLGQMSLLFTAGIAVLYGVASTYAGYAADKSYDRLLLGSATSIAETLSLAEGRISVDVPYSALDMLAAAPHDKVFYQVVGLAGETVTGYGDLPDYRGPSGRGPVEETAYFFDANYRGDSVRFVVLRREVRVGDLTGWMRVKVGQTREARNELETEITLRAIIPLALLAAIAAMTTWVSVGRAVQPLGNVSRQLAARDPSDLSPVSEGEVPAEIVPLVAAMNSFITRLDASFTLLRDFISTAAHQLRTPLTAMMVDLRSAQTATGLQSRDALEAATRSGERLARLVDQLLSDALVSHRAKARQFAPFDLRAAVERALQIASPQEWKSDVRFTSRIDTAQLRGDEAMVTEAIKNLVHNALTHGDTDHGTIEIALGAEADGFVLTVADQGPGLPADILERPRTRFKSPHSDGSGAGLGLAISYQVVDTHYGRLSLSNREGGGLEVRMWLPRMVAS